MEGLRALQEFARAFESIAMPSVAAPVKARLGEPTRDSVVWSSRAYAYAALVHVRIVLRGLILMSMENNRVASAVLCRHLLEWAAHTCHVNQQLDACITVQDWRRAETLFLASPDTSIPSRPRRRNKFPDVPRRGCTVPELIAEYESYQDERYGKGHGVGVHRFLEEHCSTVRAAWRQQFEYGRSGEVRIGSGAAVSILPLMVWCLVDTSVFVHSLLGLSGEKRVRGQLEQLLERYAGTIRLASPPASSRARITLRPDSLRKRPGVPASPSSRPTVH